MLNGVEHEKSFITSGPDLTFPILQAYLTRMMTSNTYIDITVRPVNN